MSNQSQSAVLIVIEAMKDHIAGLNKPYADVKGTIDKLEEAKAQARVEQEK